MQVSKPAVGRMTTSAPKPSKKKPDLFERSREELDKATLELPKVSPIPSDYSIDVSFVYENAKQSYENLVDVIPHPIKLAVLGTQYLGILRRLMFSEYETKTALQRTVSVTNAIHDVEQVRAMTPNTDKQTGIDIALEHIRIALGLDKKGQ